eukprot:gene22116-1293_t
MYLLTDINILTDTQTQRQVSPYSTDKHKKPACTLRCTWLNGWEIDCRNIRRSALADTYLLALFNRLGLGRLILVNHGLE